MIVPGSEIGRFRHVRMTLADGVLEITLHRDGDTALWSSGVDGIHRELGEAFALAATVEDLRVVILTGIGDAFMTALDPDDAEPLTATFLDRIYREGVALLENLLAIPVPVIAAVNGPANIHAELPLLADIVLAADHACFADKTHFVNGVVPGDGVHVIWPMLLGPNRGRAFLLTGEEIGAEEAKRLGLVAEVLAPDQLMPRARALAAEIARKPLATLRHTRRLLTAELRRRLGAELGHGLAAEGLALLAMMDGHRERN